MREKSCPWILILENPVLFDEWEACQHPFNNSNIQLDVTVLLIVCEVDQRPSTQVKHRKRKSMKRQNIVGG